MNWNIIDHSTAGGASWGSQLAPGSFYLVANLREINRTKTKPKNHLHSYIYKTNNPTGAGPGSVLRVLRGGYWLSDAYYARCAFRASTYPYLAIWGIGFRCVRGL